MHLSDEQKRKIFLFNNNRRELLKTEADKEESIEKKIQFIAKYFLNQLSPEQTSKIDGIDSAKIPPFTYDYSMLEDFSVTAPRKKMERGGCGIFSACSMSAVDIDRRGTDKIKVYPTIFALKMGTCQMFASEIQRFAHDFNIPSKIVCEMTYCYDNFNGKDENGKPVKTDRIIKMQHFYNILTINGKEYKLDISGALTAEDFNKNHPDKKVDVMKFYFSSPETKNPFEELVKKGEEVLDLFI